MQTETLVYGLVWYLVFLFSTTLHEAAHAWAALKLGDPTAYMGGQVSLDPAPHVQRSPVGMVLVPVASFLLNGGSWMIGWASAPYDPVWAHHYPKRSALMAAAGPAANLLIVVVAAVAIWVGLAFEFFHRPALADLTYMHVTSGIAPGQPEEMQVSVALGIVVSILFSLNLVLFVFNLIPLPPLDGSSVITLFLDDALSHRFQGLLRQPGFSLMGLLIAWQVFPRLFAPVFLFALNLLYPGMFQ